MKLDNLLTRKQAADYLGVKENTLAVWATNKRYQLPFVKVGRLVKYRIKDLDQFLMDNMVNDGGYDAR